MNNKVESLIEVKNHTKLMFLFALKLEGIFDSLWHCYLATDVLSTSHHMKSNGHLRSSRHFDNKYPNFVTQNQSLSIMHGTKLCFYFEIHDKRNGLRRCWVKNAIMILKYFRLK